MGQEFVDRRKQRRKRVSKRLILQLFYLQNFFKLCAWCHKVSDNTDHWITLEQFLDREFNIHTSHGICPNCIEQLRAEAEDQLNNQQPFGGLTDGSYTGPAFPSSQGFESGDQ